MRPRNIVGLFVALAVICTCVPVVSASEDAKTAYEHGKGFLQSRRYQEAIEAFSNALQLLDTDEKNARVVTFARAQAYFEKGDLANASKDLRAILQSQGLEGEMRAAALELRGALHLKSGRDKAALEDLTAAIKTPHENHHLRSTTFANRGIALLNLGEADRAVSDLNKAIELDPKSGFAYAGRGLAHLRRDSIELARRDAEHALMLSSDEPTKTMAEKVLNELAIFAHGPQSLSLPLSNAGHIFVQVRFSKGGKPHRFLLDTGATHSLITRDLLTEISRETEVTEIGKGKVSVADGSMRAITRYRVKTAFLYHLPLGEIEIHVFDKESRGINNLLGTRSLRNIAVSFDNARKTVEITRRQ